MTSCRNKVILLELHLSVSFRGLGAGRPFPFGSSVGQTCPMCHDPGLLHKEWGLEMLPRGRSYEGDSEMLVRDNGTGENGESRLKEMGIVLDCAVHLRHEPSWESLEGLKNILLDPTPRASDSEGVWWDLKTCISSPRGLSCFWSQGHTLRTIWIV